MRVHSGQLIDFVGFPSRIGQSRGQSHAPSIGKVHTFREGSASSTAIRTDLSAPIGRWLYRAFRNAYGAEPVRIRMMGGTVPTGATVEALRVPFAIVPLVNADNNQHSFDENMRLGNYVDGVKGLVGLLREPF